MDLICKTSPPSLDKTQCNAHPAPLSFPSLRLFRLPSSLGDWTHPAFSFTFCQWRVLCLKCWSLVYIRKTNKKKTYCNQLLCTLSKTGVSSSCPVILNHCGGATGSHSVTIKTSSLQSHSLSPLTIRWSFFSFLISFLDEKKKCFCPMNRILYTKLKVPRVYIYM